MYFLNARPKRVLTGKKVLVLRVLALLPLALALILSILNPSYLAPLLEDQIGRVAIGVALVLELIGFFVIHRIVDIEV